MRKVFYFLLVIATFVSCKEQDDTVEEFPNWAAQNDAFFSRLVSETQAKKAAGDDSVDLFPSHTLPTSGYSYQYKDYVVVQKLEWSTGELLPSPILTDTVQVHYVGQLIPSADKYKTSGMIFDRSYVGTFDPVTATPSKFAVDGVVTGFSTALMHMHQGDHWRIYVPYQLGYGTAARGSIPAGSTLIFDLRLVNFWRRK
jgi:FKBP-type peptidyl-prolyl cis-trans isomerase FklB